MRYCPRCAQANDDQAVYCTHCGFVLQAQTPPSVQTQTPPPPASYSAPYISPVYYTVPAVYTVPTAVLPVNQTALDRLRKLAGSPLCVSPHRRIAGSFSPVCLQCDEPRSEFPVSVGNARLLLLFVFRGYYRDSAVYRLVDALRQCSSSERACFCGSRRID